jgi:hypothetical protein
MCISYTPSTHSFLIGPRHHAFPKTPLQKRKQSFCRMMAHCRPQASFTEFSEKIFSSRMVFRHQTRPTSQFLVDAKCAPSAKHTASRTSWLHMCKESQDVPVNFPWKLTKDKVVRYQSLELAGWYQTVPYLRLQSQTGWHIAIESYLPMNWNHSGACKRKSSIAEWMT